VSFAPRVERGDRAGASAMQARVLESDRGSDGSRSLSPCDPPSGAMKQEWPSKSTVCHPVGQRGKDHSRPRSSRFAEYRAETLRGCAPQLLRECIDKVDIPVVGTAAKLEICKDFRLEMPHCEAVLESYHFQRMNQ
jgi:hypothetical protein